MCMELLKTKENDKRDKIDANTLLLHIVHSFLLGKYLKREIKLNVFYLENPVLTKPLPYNKKTAHFKSSHPRILCKKCILKNFEKITGTHLCQGVFFDKSTGL